MASAVATPLERRFGRIAGVTEITSTSYARRDQHHAAVRPRPRRRRRRARRPGRDQRRRRASCPPNLPTAPELPQGEPGRRADPDLSLTLATRCPLSQVFDAAQHDPRAEDLAGGGRRAGLRRRRAAARGARPGRPGGARGRRALARGRPHGARAAPPSIAEGRARRAAADARPSPRTISSLGAATVRAVVVALRGTARRSGSATSRDVVDSVENERVAGVDQRRSARCSLHHPPPARREHHRRRTSG